jgi:hypothetical protein
MDERIAFGPKALSRFTNIIEEVAVELGDDGVLLRSTEMRTRLAQRLFGLARFWWTDTQIKQLLLRTLRNEAVRGLLDQSCGSQHRPRLCPRSRRGYSTFGERQAPRQIHREGHRGGTSFGKLSAVRRVCPTA